MSGRRRLLGRLLVGQARFRRGRLAALGAGILVAAVSFSLLVSAVTTSRLTTRQVVARNFRGAYDVLVRPPGSATLLEQRHGLVQANYLSGVYGGITMRQYQAVRHVPGVQVAAPIANVGSVYLRRLLAVPIDRQLDREPTQLYRVRFTWVANAGASQYPGGAGYLYYTRQHRLHLLSRDPPAVGEVVGSGRPPLPVCGAVYRNSPDPPFLSNPENITLLCYSARTPELPMPAGRPPPATQGTSPQLKGAPTGRVTTLAVVSFPVPLAGIDPDQERALVGLDTSALGGAGATKNSPPGTVAVLASDRTYVDQALRVDVERLAAPPGIDLTKALAATHGPDYWSGPEFLNPLRGRKVASWSYDPGQLYHYVLEAAVETQAPSGGVGGWYRTGPPSYAERGAGRLAVQRVRGDNRAAWLSWSVPPGSEDTQTRPVGVRILDRKQDAPRLRVVGRYDPARLPGFSRASAVPLETYYPPQATPADAPSRQALGGRPLGPTTNLGGYIAQPPLLLTDLVGAARFASPPQQSVPPDPGGVRVDRKAPISVIRVRVAGVTGPDALSRERIRLVAERIATTTGLAVDITAGSSPSPQLVELPRGRFGQPALLVRELWVRKGVALAIIHALDRKSAALFGLVLVVCALFLTNGALAAVRGRRAELGTLLALGWSRTAIFASVLGELALVGLLAGLAGSALAALLVAVFNLRLALLSTLLVTPVSVALATVAGLVAAARATRATPLDALRPPVAATGRARPVRSVAGLALVNLRRLPGRTLLGALGLAVAVAACTVVLAINLAFGGQLAGSLLGQIVAVQVRGVDYAAVGLTVALGALSVVDVLVMNLRERAWELAVLRAAGWDDAQLRRLALLEGLITGALGGVAGALLGSGIAALLAGTVPAGLVLAAAVATTGSMLLLLAALAVPLRWLNRVAPATVLAADE